MDFLVWVFSNIQWLVSCNTPNPRGRGTHFKHNPPSHKQLSYPYLPLSHTGNATTTSPLPREGDKEDDPDIPDSAICLCLGGIPEHILKSLLLGAISKSSPTDWPLGAIISRLLFVCFISGFRFDSGVRGLGTSAHHQHISVLSSFNAGLADERP
jgi:hypothetical protein